MTSKKLSIMHYGKDVAMMLRISNRRVVSLLLFAGYCSCTKQVTTKLRHSSVILNFEFILPC